MGQFHYKATWWCEIVSSRLSALNVSQISVAFIFLGHGTYCELLLARTATHVKCNFRASQLCKAEGRKKEKRFMKHERNFTSLSLP